MLDGLSLQINNNNNKSESNSYNNSQLFQKM